jgi:tRNA threonylcarbamoyladenosine biosynthesis protein TsaB
LVILSLDTATDVATTCVTLDGDVAAESATRGRSTAAQRVLADVDHLLRAAALRPADVELVVVGTGPGTFTGLRVGIATARALAFALGVEVRGVSTLEALRANDGVEVACVDARRGQVFAAGAGLEPCVLEPGELRARVPGGVLVAGDGAIRYREELVDLRVPADGSPLHVPWARHHAARAVGAGPPEPLYLRAPDADRVLGRTALA